jgi:prevent-host-death family protein
LATTTFSSREFNQKTNEAKKAAQDGPVFITDRGKPSHVLMTIEEYRKIGNAGNQGKSILEMLAMPGDDYCEDFESLIPPRTIEDLPPFEFD